MTLKLKTMLAATTLALGVASGASAGNLTANQWMAPTYAQSIHPYKNMFDRIRDATGGQVDVETFYGGSLLPPKTTMQGVRDGVVDIGFVYPAYTPAELPVQTFINSASFTVTDSLVGALAFTELMYTNNTLKTELDSFNVVATGAFMSPGYIFMCNSEVKNLEGASGKRFRTGGAAYTGLADKINGTAVSVPISDAYSGLQRGNLDCVMIDPPKLISASLNEVVKSITTVKMGGATGVLWVINKSSWAKISEDNRKLMLKEMVRALVATHAEWTQQVEASFADAEKRGIVVVEPAEDLAQALEDYKLEFSRSVVNDSEGVDKPQELMDEYSALQEKWKDLLQGVDRADVEAVTAIVSKELLGKIDPVTFGLK